MGLFERIVDGQFREIVKLSDNQCHGIMADCGTVNAIHVTRLRVEKHRGKQKPVHLDRRNWTGLGEGLLSRTA